MKIKYIYLKILRGNQILQKAFGLALLLKRKTVYSRIECYSINKMRKIAGISHETAKKLESVMLQEGYIHFEGNRENRILVVNSLSSSYSSKNICIDCFDFSSYKSVLKCLQAFIFIYKLVNITYIKQLYQNRHNPKNKREFKATYKKMKDLSQRGVIKDINAQFHDNGISLKKIAEVVGCDIKTAQKIIKFAIDKEWIKKNRRQESFYAPKVNYRNVEGYTFATKDNLYRILPNNYPLSEFIKELFRITDYLNAA